MQNSKLEKIISGLCPGTIFPFWHKGEWAVHEVLPILFAQYGVGDVCVSSFTVSEDSLRTLFFLKDNNQIGELTLLLDNTVKRHKMDMLLFLRSITIRVRFDSVHSKLLLFKAEDFCFCLVGSANLNLNARYECGYISTRSDDYDFFKQSFDKAYNDGLEYDPIE